MADDKARQPKGRDQQPDAGGQATVGKEGDATREALAAHAHGEVRPSSQRADQTDAVAGLKADDPRAEAQQDPKEALAGAVAGNERVQAQVDAENAQGFRGLNPDPTPNENYTFGGVARGLPTPETDPKLAAQARENLFPGAGRFSMTEEGVAERERRRQARDKSNEG
jgi:hypothetical protein